jgi:hypothetical protein
MHHLGKFQGTRARILTRGGTLEVTFVPTAEGYSNIQLKGPAEHVFSGTLE